MVVPSASVRPRMIVPTREFLFDAGSSLVNVNICGDILGFGTSEKVVSPACQ